MWVNGLLTTMPRLSALRPIRRHDQESSGFSRRFDQRTVLAERRPVLRHPARATPPRRVAAAMVAVRESDQAPIRPQTVPSRAVCGRAGDPPIVKGLNQIADAHGGDATSER